MDKYLKHRMITLWFGIHFFLLGIGRYKAKPLSPHFGKKINYRRMKS